MQQKPPVPGWPGPNSPQAQRNEQGQFERLSLYDWIVAGFGLGVGLIIAGSTIGAVALVVAIVIVT